jgi:hypothetical protein
MALIIMELFSIRQKSFYILFEVILGKFYRHKKLFEPFREQLQKVMQEQKQLK